MKRLIRNTLLLPPFLLAVLLAGCNSSETSNNAPFSIAAASPTVAIQEGDAAGISIPISITRAAGHTAALTLTAATSDQQLSANFNSNELTPEIGSTTLNVSLALLIYQYKRIQ